MYPKQRRGNMPHITIKHFPVEISKEIKSDISKKIIETISHRLNCSEDVISISMIEVDQNEWNEKVYIPEIIGMSSFLIKKPNY